MTGPRGATRASSRATRRRRAAAPAGAPSSRLAGVPWRLVLAGVFAAAFLWRLGYLARLAASPLADSRIADASVYWEWADFLLRHGPGGPHPFFLAPLYPYVLAALRLVTGDVAGRVLWVQAAWGAGAAVLLADAARRLTRPAIGAVVGVAAAFAGMAVFFDGLFLAESLLFAVGSLALWLVARRGSQAPTARFAALLGALLGVLAQGRGTAAVMLLPALALVAAPRGSWRRASARAAALLAAFALLCAPAAIHNARTAGAFVPFTYNGGYNLYVGNNPDATGGFVSVTGTHDIADAAAVGGDGGVEADGRSYLEALTGRALGPAESSREWSGRALAWMREHPGRTARLWLRKLALAWSRHESPQIENAAEFRLLAGPLGIPWLGSFALLAALAWAGAAAAWRRGPRERFLAGALVAGTLALLPFFVTDRYRHQLVPAALLLAAIAADELWRRRARPTAAMALGAALGLALAFWPVPRPSAARTAMSMADDMGVRWLERGRADLARTELDRAVRMDALGQVRWSATTDDSVRHAVLYYDHARVLTRLGLDADAAASLRRAASLAPGSKTIRTALAAALAATGDVSGAERTFEAAGDPDARLATIESRARAAARTGDLAGAERLFASVVEADPERLATWGALVRVRAQLGQPAAAHEALERGRAAGWSGPSFEAHRALVLALEGDKDGARRALAGVPARDRAADPVIADVCRGVEGLLAR